MTKPRTKALAFTWLAWTCILIAFSLIASHAWGSVAPGCGNQHFRPRLSQCCPRYLAGEALPPKCDKPLAEGWLAQCCEGVEPTPVVTATPAPSPTECRVKHCSPTGYSSQYCWWDDSACVYPTPTSSSCAEPTPLPTPQSHAKGECCREALAIHRTAFRALQAQYKLDKAALAANKRAQMRTCKEGY